MRRILVMVVCLLLAFGSVSPVMASLPVEEGGLLAGGEAYEINPDTQGGLWISDWGLVNQSDGYVWWLKSVDSSVVVYTVPGLPTDARRDGNYFWWVDGDSEIIGRAEVGADGATSVAYSTWQTTAVNGHYGSAVDAQGRLWATDALYNKIFRLTEYPGENNDELCTYILPDTGMSTYLAYDDPFLWIGEHYNGILYRLNVTNNVVESWTLPDYSSPSGLAVDIDGDLWYADYYLSEILEVDPDLNEVHRYHLPDNQTTIMTTIESGHIWFTGDDPPIIGIIDPDIASFTIFSPFHESGMWAPTCDPTVEPAISDTLSVSTAPVQFSPPIEYPVGTMESGLQIYTVPPDNSTGTPISARPWGIANQNGLMWVVDSGRQKLLQIDPLAVILPSYVFLPLIAR